MVMLDDTDDTVRLSRLSNHVSSFKSRELSPAGSMRSQRAAARAQPARKRGPQICRILPTTLMNFEADSSPKPLG